MTIEAPFDISEIEDVRMIMVVGGKHYAIFPADGREEAAKIDRIVACALTLTQKNHIICSTPLEEIREAQEKERLNKEED